MLFWLIDWLSYVWIPKNDKTLYFKHGEIVNYDIVWQIKTFTYWMPLAALFLKITLNKIFQNALNIILVFYLHL